MDNLLRMSYSKVDCWLSCRQMWYWKYKLNLAKKGTKTPLQVGAIVHDLMHRHYMHKPIPQDIEAYIKEKYPDNPETATGVAYEALTLMEGYLSAWEKDYLNVISSEMKIELPRVEPITKQEYTIYVIVDALARDEKNRLWRVEHKTASRVDQYYLAGLRGGLQGGIYHHALTNTLLEPVVGTIYNMIVKTKIPQYPRMPVMMQKGLAQRSVDTFDGVVREILKNDIFPNAGRCFAYSEDCEYLPLCQAWKGKWDSDMERIARSFYRPYYDLRKEEEMKKETKGC